MEVEAMSDWNRKVIEEFRADQGKVAAFARQPLLLLNHTGAPTNPDWYYNLLANPQATIEVGIEQLAVTTEPVSPVERERLWAMVIERNPAFKEYGNKTRRVIPLVILTPSLPGSNEADMY
jgi:deazaflavin-dependent oxidoreductase (nitroreductase family)